MEASKGVRCGGRSLVLVLGSVVVVLGLLVVGGCEGFNRDRPVYKWSPLWFNSHLRPGTLFKRARDEPIEKWSPTYFESFSPPYDQKRDHKACGRENSVCAHVISASGVLVRVRCCGVLQCLPTGTSFTCTDPKTYVEEELEGGDHFDYYTNY